jgi:NAD(P)-dependent dehydrogenase (short-subunit alcohol dehydrogenase family)
MADTRLGNSEMKSVFITGASRGFGHAMAQKLLAEGFQVYSCSRTCPPDLNLHERFHWAAIDLSLTEKLGQCLQTQLMQWGVRDFDLVVLNAGQFGPSPRPALQVSLCEFTNVLDVNLIANKIILDCLLGQYQVRQCLFCASIAGVRLRAGTLGYGVSKAALNALALVYAKEHPETFFAVLGLCNLQTNLLQNALNGPHVEQFPEIVALRDRALTANYVTHPVQRAEQVWQLYSEGFGKKLESGVFSEVRNLITQ